jgi:cyanophycin synthetase
MEFRRVRALRGPNVWANFPVLEALVDLGDLKDTASDTVPGFNERLMAWLPTLIEHRCSVGERGGFCERLRRGTYPPHVLEHVTLELQSLAGTDVGFGRARATAEDGVYKVVVEYAEEALARACLEAARDLILAALGNKPYEVGRDIERLRQLAQQVRLDPGTAAIARAARKRRIPVMRLGSDGLLQLGQGARQRRVLAGRTDRTGALAESIAHDHEVTRTLLKAAGVPVAAEEDSSVRVEPHAAGAAWRMLVVGGRLVAAVRREADATHVDVTDQVHPETAAHAVEAARAVGLDPAGVDVIAGDISQPLEGQGGVVTGVVAAPDLAPYLEPAAGSPRPVGEAIVAALFPEGQNGRIPVVGVTGVNGKTTTTRLIAHILGRWGRCVGMTCTDGIFVGGRRIDTGDCSGPRSAQAVLRNPRVEAAVLETARGGILREGLGFDRCDVAVVTNIADGDHLGLADIETPEQLAKVKRTLVEAVGREGIAVLKADDPLVADMATHCRGSVIFFARDAAHPVLVAHRAVSGRAVFARDGRIVLADGAQEIPLVSLERVPVTHGGRVGFQVENALASAAAAWALGIPCEAIHAALESFACDIERAPVRFNLLEVNGATVILDYGHNVSSLQCLIEALEHFPHRRRTAVYSAAGDRRDGDLVRQAELLAEAFDRVVVFEEDNCIRGRKAGEIFRLFRQGLAGGGRVREVQEVTGNVRAAEVALDSVQPGELVLIQVDVIDETINLVRRYRDGNGGSREIDFGEAVALSRAGRTPAAAAAV